MPVFKQSAKPFFPLSGWREREGEGGESVSRGQRRVDLSVKWRRLAKTEMGKGGSVG